MINYHGLRRLAFGVLLSSFGNLAWAGTLTVGNVNAVPGEAAVVVALHFSPESGEEVAGLQVDLAFDGSALGVATAHEGATATEAGKEVSLNILDDDTARIIVAGFNQNVLGTGNVADVEFRVSSDALNGTYPIAAEELLLAGPFGQDIASIAVNGSITVVDSPDGDTGVGGNSPPIGCSAKGIGSLQPDSQLPGWGDMLVLTSVAVLFFSGMKWKCRPGSV